MSRKKMLSILILQHSFIWNVIAIVGFLILLIAGLFFDTRFFFLALIWVFLIIPMLISFMYFYYGMIPMTTYNTIPHKFTFDKEVINIHFINHQDVKNKEGEIFREMVVPRNKIDKIILRSDYAILLIKSPEKGWLWLPGDCFYSKKDLINVLSYERYY